MKVKEKLEELSQRLNLSDEDIIAIEEHYKNKKINYPTAPMKCEMPVLTLRAHSYKASNCLNIFFSSFE